MSPTENISIPLLPAAIIGVWVLSVGSSVVLYALAALGCLTLMNTPSVRRGVQNMLQNMLQNTVHRSQRGRPSIVDQSRTLLLGVAGTPIGDNYETLDDIKCALKEAGMEACELLLFLDATKSTITNGERTFNGKPLHALTGTDLIDFGDVGTNPFEDTITAIAASLSTYDDDDNVPLYYFGSVEAMRHQSKVHKVGSFGIDALVDKYRTSIVKEHLSGPTSFAPLIREAARVASGHNRFHVALIITDGATLTLQHDKCALIEASSAPVVFIFVGVGDGPFNLLDLLDDMDGRRFDNVQAVEHSEFMGRSSAKFATRALQELPIAYSQCVELGMLA